MKKHISIITLFIMVVIMSICPLNVKAAPPHVHKWLIPTEQLTPCEDKIIDVQCSGCQETRQLSLKGLGHQWGDWIESEKPTCNDEGKAIRTCQRNQCTDEAKLEKLQHLYSEWSINPEKKPTCTIEGEEIALCKNGCNSENKRKINPLGHCWSVWKVIKPATCTDQGLKERTCSRIGCSGKETVTISKIPHNYNPVQTTVTPATIGKKGSKINKQICKTCKYEKKSSTEIPAISGDIKVVTSTVTYDGKEHKPKVKVLDTKGKEIPSSKYTVAPGSSQDFISAGKKDVVITFKGNEYSGKKTIKKGFEIKPKKKYTLILGKELKLKEIAGDSNGKFVLDKKYTEAKGYYKFKVIKSGKAIKTDVNKVKYEKMKPKFVVKTEIGGKEYKTDVMLELPDPTFKVKKSKGLYNLYFVYNYPKNSKIDFKIKNDKYFDKILKNYTKKHKKTEKNIHIFYNKDNIKKLKNEVIISFKVKCKGWKIKTIEKKKIFK